MSSRVVYDGVNRGNGDYEGTLFNGIKFWVAQRVPSRSTYITKLKNNGAKIVLLEQLADVMIADHARPKDALPNAVSFRYIDECIKKGTLCNVEEYKIHKAKSSESSTSLSHTHSAKVGRTPFTADDDATLINWVVKKHHSGHSAKGNKIYDELAALHPHHTSQSWRDRWVKKYSHISQENLPYLGMQGSAPQPSALDVRLATPSGPPAIRTQRDNNLPRRRVPFTAEDDEILREYVEERVHAGERESGNKIYQELEEQYPHHTYHSWRDRYQNKFHLREQPSPDLGTAITPPQKTTNRRHANNSRTTASVQGTPGPSMETRPLTEKAKRLKELRAARMAQNLQAKDPSPEAPQTSAESAVVTPQTAPELALITPQTSGRSATLRSHGTLSPSIKTEPDDSVRIPGQGESDEITEERVFYSDLEVFHKARGLVPFKNVEVPLKLHDDTTSTVLPLWVLWSKVTEQDCPHESRVWEDVATAVDIDLNRFPNAPGLFQSLFEKYLLEFEQLRNSYPESSDDESDDELDDSHASKSPSPVLPTVEEKNLPSSPPPIDGRKRTFDQVAESSEIGLLRPSAKRRRYTEDQEIPCSPEAVRRVDQSRAHLMSSPQRLPVLPRPLRNVEPETQDFDFDQVGDGQLPDDQLDSPSQQLRFDAIRHIDTDSSDDFDPPPPPGPSVSTRCSTGVQEVRRRTLPAGWSKSTAKPRVNENPNGARMDNSRQAVISINPSARSHKSSSQHRVSTPAAQRVLPPTYSQPSRSLSSHKNKSPATSPTKPVKPPPEAGDLVDYSMSLGYPKDIVMTALHATTYTQGEAVMLMQRLKSGEGIPYDMSGVWTSKDDDGIRLMHASAKGKIIRTKENMQAVYDEKKRLEKKHGFKTMMQRAKFLDCMPIY